MKICGMVGSPVKDGNVDLLVSEVLKGAASRGAETHKLYLNDMRILACQSCGVDPTPKYCIYDDDMQLVYDALDTCDAIVLGTPVYFDTVSAQTKLMIDRCNCVRPYVMQPDGTFAFERRMKKKKLGVLVAVSGPEQRFDMLVSTIKGFFKWVKVELVESILYAHSDNETGGVKKNKRELERAFKVGARLAEKQVP